MTSLPTLVFREKKNPQPVHTWTYSQTSCIWQSTSLTGVCPKWRPWRMIRHLRRSETAFNSAAFWWKGTKTSHRGLSQVTLVGGWPAEHHWRLESPQLKLLCACWHCHDGAVDHGLPFGDAVYTMPGRFFTNSGWYASQPWPSFCPQAVWWQHGQILQINMFGSTSVSFESHWSVLIWEDPNCQQLLRLGVVLVYPGFVSCYYVPNARRPSYVKFSWHAGAPFHLTPLLLFTQQVQRFLTPRLSWRMWVRLPDEIFTISCISAYIIFWSFLIKDSTPGMSSGVPVVAIRT